MTTMKSPPPEVAAPSQDSRLIQLMTDLTDVLERETAVVEAHLNEQLPELVLRKQRLLIDYQAEFKAVSQQPEWLKQLPAQQKDTLRNSGSKLDAATTRNARIVGVAMTATQRLLQGIISSVRNETTQRQGYKHLAQPNAPIQTPSVFFNTTA
jgi:hypothetical protein